MYRKNVFLDLQKSTTDSTGRVGGVSQVWGIFKHLLKSLKKMFKCLIFNGLVH
jgi:hypothetical protein